MHIQKPLTSYKRTKPLTGEFKVPGDKSISHRALIFSALAHGESKITGLLEGEDVLKTATALQKMGVEIERNKDFWKVNGVGVAGLIEPDDVLDMGNSGTAARLLAGLVSPYNFNSFFTGDASLRKRPMKRVFEPLMQNGCKIVARNNDFMPFVMIGAKNPLPINYTMKMASAQVKSAILLSALTTNGKTKIIEPEKCRDHTEIMMKHLGLEIESKDIQINGKTGTEISYQGMQTFDATDFNVPSDISSAAFLIVAALLVKDSKILLKNIGVNPLRTGLLDVLIAMGANIKLQNKRLVCGEEVADIAVEYSELQGIEIDAQIAPRMIDEYPILAVAASFAKGTTKMNGLEELKVKESNRLAAIARNLENCGVEAKMGDDFLEVKGGFKKPKELIKITTHMDHRIAMSFIIMGLRLEIGVEIDDSSMINTSFPGFPFLEI